MAKIDITTLPGYKENMTAEEKLALFEAYEMPEPSDTAKTVKKDLYDKTASELATLKKELKARMTEEEQREAERQAADAAIREELETLKKEKTLATNRSKFLEIGMDEKLATSAATNLTDGNIDKLFEDIAAYKAALDQAAKANAIADVKTPPAGSGSIEPDYTKALSEALSRGDMAGYAAVLRLQQEAAQKNT